MMSKTTDETERRLEQLDRAIAHTKRYLAKLMGERYDLMMMKHAPLIPERVVKVCDTI